MLTQSSWQWRQEKRRKKEGSLEIYVTGSEWENFFLDKCDCKWKSCASFLTLLYGLLIGKTQKHRVTVSFLVFKMFKWMQDSLARKAQETEEAVQWRQVSTEIPKE